MKYKKHEKNLLARIKDWENRKGMNTYSKHQHKRPGSQKS